MAYVLLQRNGQLFRRERDAGIGRSQHPAILNFTPGGSLWRNADRTIDNPGIDDEFINLRRHGVFQLIGRLAPTVADANHH